MRYPPGGAEFQECMRDRCLKECPSSLLDEIQYDDAKARCVQKGLLDGDADFQTCVTNSLNGTVEEEYRCRLQFFDTNTYCTGLNYTSGEYKYQDCITKSIIYRARKYCERDDDDDDDRLNLHKCISDQLAGLCSSDTLCEERYPDAQSYCAPENGDEYGNPEFQKCVAKLLDPFCRKDFACDKRKEDSEDYCRDHDHEDLKELDTKFDKCMKDCLGAICPEYSEAAQQHYKQYAMDL
ncbi:hypothetical protein CB0940_12009 [Cercospora beticola]|uniref:Uncharacterized protein n=1 Tax=Cercospora beticola TaxID=122368 RepID=A0A2G5IDL4_CERBT|nr:hypothetical protein CB0940_12009 [Cercospora beticola]PIB02891.1 hypothetical protein CB0940_12009 [Cercospora beticola]WPB04391.1 hypothetical protein RHO25_009037 [Cercospora beticola]